MNKKNIAIAMSGLTVLASAAPVFANVTTGEEGYTVSQKDYKSSETNSRWNKECCYKSINVYFDGSSVKSLTVTTGETDANKEAREQEAKDFYNTVDGKLDGLGDGKYVDFEIVYNKGIEEYTKLS